MPAHGHGSVAVWNAGHKQRNANKQPKRSPKVGPKRQEFVEKQKIKRQESTDSVNSFMNNQRAMTKRNAHETMWSVAHRKYDQLDKDGNGTLDREELKQLMQELHNKSVNDDEVEYLMVKFDTSNNGGIERKEMEKMLFQWQTYVQALPEVEAFFTKYDTDGSGRIEPDELKKLLTELNEGNVVTDEDVAWVMERADVTGNGAITKMEMKRALALWYDLDEDHKKSSLSKCCTIQ